MFPFDKEKRVRKPSMTGLFDDMFAQFEEEMGRMMTLNDDPKGRSLVWGYSAYTGPDGKTHVNEYGNMPRHNGQAARMLEAPTCGPDSAQTEADGTVEPYYDVLDKGETIDVVVELPGVEKEMIKVQSRGRHVGVNAEGPYHKYAAYIQVPDYVGGKPEKAEYKNGVLAITYMKEEAPEDVNVE